MNLLRELQWELLVMAVLVWAFIAVGFVNVGVSVIQEGRPWLGWTVIALSAGWFVRSTYLAVAAYRSSRRPGAQESR